MSTVKLSTKLLKTVLESSSCLFKFHLMDSRFHAILVKMLWAGWSIWITLGIKLPNYHLSDPVKVETLCTGYDLFLWGLEENFQIVSSHFFLIGKLQMHLVVLEPITLSFTLFLLKEEVLFELELIGLCWVISCWVDATGQLIYIARC